ncbi:MAG TPA: PAS domain S-box protein [Kofleriaceae bacterium]|nr:PAS domain S-box protein [Kofleriaceae bacterium]
MAEGSGRGLFESEERYASVVRAMTEGVILQDADSVILACNEAAERLLGLSADQMMGRTSLDPRWRSIHEDGSPFPGETHPVPVTLRTGQPQRSVVMGVHKPDGSLTWLSINSEPLFRAGSATPYAAVCTFFDITQRKLAEDALRASEERYRRILDTTLEGVWMIDLTGTTVFANRRMAEMLGCTVDELVRSTVWDFTPDASRDFVIQQIAARARGESSVHEFQFRRKAGDTVWTSMATSPITLADGSKGALAMVRDITAQREIEHALREKTEHLDIALAAGQMALWEYTIDTGASWASPQMRELVGIAADAPLATPEDYLRTVHPDDRPEIERKMRAYVETGTTEPFRNDFRIVRPDGRMRWVHSSGRAIVTPAGHRRVLGVVVDVTESHALEEQLHQARQLESLGRLAGGVAHDFNNLLTAILASVTFAEMSRIPGLDEELRTIRTAAERGAELTSQLLAFARKQVIELASIDLDDLIERLAGVLQRLLREDVSLQLELARDLWRVRAGRSQVEQVLVNLVVNAGDAMPDGGAIDVITRNVVVEPAHVHAGVPPGEYVTIAVRDHGTGIDATTLPHIFEPFYSTKRTGTGLGLASTYGIVKQLGGHIRVDSALGTGTTFTIYFARDRRPITEPGADRASERHAVHAAATVLLVEDDPLLQRVIARGLRQAGYTVLVARDGEQALDLARDTAAIDVLVTDVVMPKLSGRQLVERFVALHPRTQVLFVSGYTADIIARKGILEPGQNFLAKPYTIDALVGRIEQLLAHRR